LTRPIPDLAWDLRSRPGPAAAVPPTTTTGLHPLKEDETNGSTEQLRAHLQIAKDNGLTEVELKEVIIHLACYAGWPRDVCHHRRQTGVRIMIPRCAANTRSTHGNR
jgi:Carboxymuconolactone decarboxylase family